MFRSRAGIFNLIAAGALAAAALASLGALAENTHEPGAAKKICAEYFCGVTFF